MKSKNRGMFPVESRQVIGAVKGTYATHIQAVCSDCPPDKPFTEWLKPSTTNGSVPVAMGERMFRRRGWDMGTTRSKDVCPGCVAKSRTSKPSFKPLSAVKPDTPEIAAVVKPAKVKEKAPPMAPPGPPDKPRQGRFVGNESVRVFRPEGEKVGGFGELLIEAAAAKLKAEQDKLKETASKVTPEEKTKREQVSERLREDQAEAERQRELREIVDAQVREDSRVRRTGKLAPMALPQNFKPKPGTPVAPKPVPPQPPLAKIIDLDDGLPKAPPILIKPAPEPEPAPAPTPAPKAKKVKPPEPTPEEVEAARIAKEEAKAAYWTTERGIAHLAAQKLGRDKRAAANRGIPVEQYQRERDEREAAAVIARAERERRDAEKAAAKAARLLNDPMLAQVEMDLTPAPEPEPVLEVAPPAPPPTPKPEVAPPAPAAASKEPTMTDAKPEPKIADLSPPERKIVRDVLLDDYNEDKACWRGDLSDKTVADRINLPRIYVTLMREAMGLGDDVNESSGKIEREINELRDMLAQDKKSDGDLLVKADEAITRARTKAEEIIQQAERQLKRDIQAAGDVVTKALAERETARTEAERRLGDLIERAARVRR